MDPDRHARQSFKRRLTLALFIAALPAWPVGAAAAGADSGDPDLQSLKIEPQTSGDERNATQLAFDETPIFRTSNQKVLTVTAGDTAIKLPVIRATGGFAVTPNHCDLGPHDSCALSVSFSPQSRGHAEGAIELATPNGQSRVIAKTNAVAIGPDEHVLWWLALAYVCAMLFFRWNMIALPSRNIVQANITIARARAEHLKLSMHQAQPILDRVSALLEDASEAVTVSSRNPLDYLFWSRGLEVKGLVMMHAAELMMVPYFPPEEVRSRLEQAESELRDIDKPGATEIADSIRSNLAASVAPAASALRATTLCIRHFLHQLHAQLLAAMARFATPPTAPQLDELRVLLSDASGSPAAAKLGDEIAAASRMQPDHTPFGQQGELEAGYRLLRALAEVTAEFNTLGPMPQQRLAAAARDFSDVLHSMSARLDAILGSAEAYPLLRWRALLTRALAYLNDRSDTDDATFLSWQNKTVWLTACGIVLMIALSFEHGNGALFVLGGVGGLLSRLSRSLFRQDVPTDYGSSWTTLFMSVVVGALAGWCGVLLVQLMISMGLLGTLFQAITWEKSYTPVVFGMAILFGFSERQFDFLLSSIGDNFSAKDRAATAPPAPLAPLTITTPASSVAISGNTFNLQLEASGGERPYVWRLTEPGGDGVALNPDTGLMTLKATARGHINVTVCVLDKNKASVSKQFGIDIV